MPGPVGKIIDELKSWSTVQFIVGDLLEQSHIDEINKKLEESERSKKLSTAVKTTILRYWKRIWNIVCTENIMLIKYKHEL